MVLLDFFSGLRGRRPVSQRDTASNSLPLATYKEARPDGLWHPSEYRLKAINAFQPEKGEAMLAQVDARMARLGALNPELRAKHLARVRDEVANEFMPSHEGARKDIQARITAELAINDLAGKLRDDGQQLRRDVDHRANQIEWSAPEPEWYEKTTAAMQEIISSAQIGLDVEKERDLKNIHMSLDLVRWDTSSESHGDNDPRDIYLERRDKINTLADTIDNRFERMTAIAAAIRESVDRFNDIGEKTTAAGAEAAARLVELAKDARDKGESMYKQLDQKVYRIATSNSDFGAPGDTISEEKQNLAAMREIADKADKYAQLEQQFRRRDRAQARGREAAEMDR